MDSNEKKDIAESLSEILIILLIAFVTPAVLLMAYRSVQSIFMIPYEFGYWDFFWIALAFRMVISEFKK